MPHIEDVLLFAIAQRGDRYVFGTEVNPLRPDSDKWDCSELVQIACGAALVVPAMPDGAYYQWKHTQLHGIPVSRALGMRGALLFHGDGTGVGRDAITHVAMSIGNHLTIEARGKAWGVGTWGGDGRFQFAALIPGCDYTPRSPLTPPTKEDDMKPTDIVDALTTPTDDGVWLLQRDGGVNTKGKAKFYGSYPGLPPAQRLDDTADGIRQFVSIEPFNGGYRLLANDGAIYRFPAK